MDKCTRENPVFAEVSANPLRGHRHHPGSAIVGGSNFKNKTVQRGRALSLKLLNRDTLLDFWTTVKRCGQET